MRRGQIASHIYYDRNFWERGLVVDVPDAELGAFRQTGVLAKLRKTLGSFIAVALGNWTLAFDQRLGRS